jgi:hypothetical protein
VSQNISYEYLLTFVFNACYEPEVIATDVKDRVGLVSHPYGMGGGIGFPNILQALPSGFCCQPEPGIKRGSNATV